MVVLLYRRLLNLMEEYFAINSLPLLQIELKQIKLTINHKWKAVSKLSINLPAIQGIVKELIPKHWEYKAIAVPWYWMGEDFTIESEADGRNIHREIVKGMKAKGINRYPLSNKLESDKKIKPISSDIKHNVNL